MEKFSKWRDPSTGIQPFLPISGGPVSPIAVLLLPLVLVISFLRFTVLLVLAILHVTLGAVLAPVRPASNALTYICARTALAVLGWYWIPTEVVSAKRARGAVEQAPPPPRRGDLIIANWTSWVDVLILAYLHNPTFIIPVFATPAPLPSPAFGRGTGTGSANVLATGANQPPCAGYMVVGALSLMARTGSLPPAVDDVPNATVYPTIAAARRASTAPVVLFPEATTSNGRAVLRFGDGVLSEDVGMSGVVWIKFIRHAPPTPLLPAAPCPLPRFWQHLRSILMTLPLARASAVRTLHPSAAPSSPSFLPSEILAAQPGGLGAVRDGAAWRDACAVILAETGRVRRVPGMGWVEKASFLDYYARSRR